MVNILTMNIDKLENLPKKESRKEYITRKYGDMWNLRRFDHPWSRSDSNDYPWVKANRVIKKYLGRSFDKAFSEYCRKVKLHEQDEFLRLFRGTRWHEPDYLIDSQKRIQFNPNRYKGRKRDIIFTSADYKIGYYNTIDKTTISLDDIHRQSARSRIGWNEYYYQTDKRYVQVVISGFKKTFKSEEDVEYQKLMAEKVKALRKEKRLRKKAHKDKKYIFLTAEEIANKIKNGGKNS